MLVNILSTEIKERAIILTVKTVGFLARMDNNLNVNELVYNVLKNVMTLEEDETDTNLFLYSYLDWIL